MTSQVMTTEQLRNSRAPATRTTVGMTDSDSFELAQRAGKLLAASGLVPKEYQGNMANCVVALNMASRIGADPLMVMQNLVVIHGRPTWSSQFLIATFNACGRFSSVRYEFFGEKGTDSWGCRAWAIEKETNQRIEGSDITIALAKKEGWYSKGGSKWQSIPQQMLMYRAASWLVRAYAPELAMGLHTADEVVDMVDVSAPRTVETMREMVSTVEQVVAQPAEQTDLKTMINNAKTLADLESIRPMIGDLDDVAQQDELLMVWTAKKDAIA